MFVVATILSRPPNMSPLPDLTLPSAVQQSGTANAIGASSPRLAPLVEETTAEVLPQQILVCSGTHARTHPHTGEHCRHVVAYLSCVLFVKEYFLKELFAAYVVATGVSNLI